jgi:predicted kinase
LPQHLILIRGLPGAGKSTLARSMNLVHLEADMYFMHNGKYNFDASKLAQAHQWCLNQTKLNLRAGKNVVVANTFIRYWEIKPYIELAKAEKIESNIICCVGNFRSVHDIDTDTLNKMVKNWQKCQWLKQEIYQPLVKK